MEVGDRESQGVRYWQCLRSTKLCQNDVAHADYDYAVYDDAADSEAADANDADDGEAADTDDDDDDDDSDDDADDCEAADETDHSGPAKDEKRQRGVSDSEAGNERGDEASDPEHQVRYDG